MSSRKNKNLLDIVPIYSPRTTYNNIKINDEKMIADMTLNFDKITIALLRQQFQKMDGELTLEQFITLAKRHLKFWQPDMPNREQNLQRFLTQLFNQIDINGNGDMQWKQFTNYIIQKATVLKNLKSKSQEIKRYVKSDVQPKIKIDGIIQKAQYIKDIEKMAFFEQGSCKIYFMDINDGSLTSKPLQIDPKKLIINISSIKKNKQGKVQIRKKDLQIPTQVRVLDILYLNDKKYKTLLVATSDGYVRGWKHVQNGFVLATQPDNQQQMFQHYFNSQIYCLAWDNVNEVLYCGQKSGNISMWNLKTDLQRPLLNQQKQNTDQKESNQQKINLMITSMITMPKLQFMASGRMDGKLILWDTINNKKKWTYKQHSRGILSLAFNQSMILLFSAGFDHKICVWNPYIQTLIHKIQIHLAPIISLRVIQQSNQLISLDGDGVVKITDTKRFHGIYSFSIQKQDSNQLVNPSSNGFNLSSFIAIDKPLKLIFIGKSISIYEYDKNYNPFAADENYVVACQFIKQTLSFVTASGNKIKVWSALNGDINKIFIDISQHEITAMALDGLKKRVVIGDIEGNVTVHNVLNGAKMKHLTKHNCQILQLVTMKNQVQMLVSCSIDNEIRIFKQADDNYQIVRYIYFRKDIQITQLKYQTNIKLIMVGTNVGTVGFYDIQTGKNVGNCLNKNLQEITSLCQTNESIMITTTSSGKINLFGIPPSSNKFQKLLSFCHRDCQKQGNIPIGITTSCYNQKQNYLYVVDDKMYLTCYDLNQIKNYKAGVKQANNDTESIMDLHKRLQKLKFKVKWQVKSNHQLIKLAEYVPEENLIITCFFDKKVKIWNATTGQYIDSLQQNYNKCVPQPIAYYDTRNYMLYTKNKKKTIDRVQIDLQFLQNNCQQLQNFIQKYDLLKTEKSNQQWNLKVSLKTQKIKDKMLNKCVNQEDNKQNCQSSEKNQQLPKIIMSSKQEFMIRSNSAAESLQKIRKNINLFKTTFGQFNQKGLLGSKQNLDQDENKSMHSTQKLLGLLQTQNNFFNSNKQKKPHIKRSMMKCIQNCLDKKQHNQFLGNGKDKQKIKTNANKTKDYVPIYQVLGLKQRKKAAQEHNKLIQNLYKTETQSILNSRQQQTIYMGQQEAKATKKLCALLLDIDATDKRPKSLLKNIKIKHISQSMHSTFTSGLPKI